eukprot:tig00021357_g20782.t1
MSTRGLLSNLPPNITVKDVCDLCKHAANAKDVVVTAHDVRTIVRGVDSASALIELRTREEIDALRKALHDPGRTLEFRPHVASATIWVGDVPSGVSSAVLRDAFEQLGEVEDAQVVTDPITLKSKEYGFVKYKSAQVALKVKQACQENLFVLSGAPQPVSVDLAREDSDNLDSRGATLDDPYTNGGECCFGIEQNAGCFGSSNRQNRASFSRSNEGLPKKRRESGEI